MAPSPEEVSRWINALVDEQRSLCLWFLKPDYYPSSDAERVQVLDAIQRHGGLAAFQRAGELKRWLSPSSSASSASS